MNAGALKTAMAYDGFGRKSKVSHSDGTSGNMNYDPLNRIVNLRWQEKGSDSVFQALAYDLAGNIAQLSREHGSYALSYDETDQLIGSKYQGKLRDQSGSWQYDLLGNRLRDSRNGISRQTANFLLQNERSNFYSDEDGFGETVRESTKDGEKLYSYRADGKIAGFIGNGIHAIYHYDGLDRLIAKEIKTKTETFVQSFLHLGQETRVLLGKAGNGEVTTYIDGQGVAERVGEVKGTIGKGYITDHLGSVLNGDVAGSSKSFGLWGERFVSAVVTASSPAVNFGYAAGRFNSESGNTTFGARDFNDKTGTWKTQDPVGLGGGDENLYRYVKNNSVRYIDYTGNGLVSAGICAAYGAYSNYQTGKQIDQINEKIAQNNRDITRYLTWLSTSKSAAECNAINKAVNELLRRNKNLAIEVNNLNSSGLAGDISLTILCGVALTPLLP